MPTWAPGEGGDAFQVVSIQAGLGAGATCYVLRVLLPDCKATILEAPVYVAVRIFFFFFIKLRTPETD